MGRKKPGAIIRRRGRNRGRRDQFDFVMFVLHFFSPGSRVSSQKFRPPFADYSLCVCDAPSKTETTCQLWAFIAERCQREKNILRLELFEFEQRLRSRISVRKSGQRLAKKILYLRLAVKRVNVGLAPLIPRSVEVRHVGQKNCLARQKHAHGRT